MVHTFCTPTIFPSHDWSMFCTCGCVHTEPHWSHSSLVCSVPAMRWVELAFISLCNSALFYTHTCEHAHMHTHTPLHPDHNPVSPGLSHDWWDTCPRWLTLVRDVDGELSSRAVCKAHGHACYCLTLLLAQVNPAHRQISPATNPPHPPTLSTPTSTLFKTVLVGFVVLFTDICVVCVIHTHISCPAPSFHSSLLPSTSPFTTMSKDCYFCLDSAWWVKHVFRVSLCAWLIACNTRVSIYFQLVPLANAYGSLLWVRSTSATSTLRENVL
jgi:hypothetical protein